MSSAKFSSLSWLNGNAPICIYFSSFHISNKFPKIFLYRKCIILIKRIFCYCKRKVKIEQPPKEKRKKSQRCTPPGCQSSQRGHSRMWWCTISQESSQRRRIFVLDTENLCSVSISEEMGPGEACVISHLSWASSQGSGACSQPHAAAFSALFHTNPILKYPVAFHVVDFYLKRSWLFYFVTLMEAHLGWRVAFAIHIPLRDYIKSMFCHSWLMFRVFLKTGLKYENRQKWGYYKEWSIFNTTLKEEKWSAAQKCTDQDSATFCKQPCASFVLRPRHN